ncbi:MarR family winged helix-turn-helix transcriptional regulator [Reichenbachiella sp.]|uniref:MarR family winged helix-turn-helix transcriptional regulator n=1 Tax=Reichenbachiella sp. TaxID=2184521 RepID=UPI003BB00450
MASRLLAARLESSLKRPSLNITVEQWRILFYLWNEDGINQQELAKRANKEKSTITRQIEGLIKKELVVKQKRGSDKRDKLIFLTENGKKMETEALSVAWDITHDAEKGIDKDELQIFKKVLQQIIENVKP